MRRRFLAAAWFTLFASVFWPALAWAQSGQAYPYKLIRIITSPAGSNIDLIVRVIAQGLGPILGQPMVVENRPDLIAIQTAVTATPDGYTLLIQGSAPWMKPLMQKVNFDAQRDLTPITETTSAPLYLYSSPSLPVKSARELISLAKAKPGELNYGMPGAGTSAHLAAELFNSTAGVNIVRIAYKGTPQAIVNLMANQVQMVFASYSGGMPLVASGKLKVLGVANANKPSPLVPDVPTIASSGLPGFEVTSAQFMWVPVGTPGAIVNRMGEAILRVLSNPDVKKRFLNDDVETIGTTPEQTAAYIKAENAKWSKVVKEAGIRTDD